MMLWVATGKLSISSCGSNTIQRGFEAMGRKTQKGLRMHRYSQTVDKSNYSPKMKIEKKNVSCKIWLHDISKLLKYRTYCGMHCLSE